MFSRFKTNLKNFFLRLQPHRFLSFLTRPSLLFSNTLKLSKWIAENKNPGNKDHLGFADREDLYKSINERFIANEAILYLEFGVFKGASIKWWANANNNSSSEFFGFDTFEGLPESWGVYEKGAFNALIPDISDQRVHFVKGLFQDTLLSFLQNRGSVASDKRLVLHMDPDLFSSTLFVLTTIRPLLKKNDIILFDEFFVPNDEFAAFEIFCRSYYISFELLGATKNYVQTAIRITA